MKLRDCLSGGDSLSYIAVHGEKKKRIDVNLSRRPQVFMAASSLESQQRLLLPGEDIICRQLHDNCRRKGTHARRRQAARWKFLVPLVWPGKF